MVVSDHATRHFHLATVQQFLFEFYACATHSTFDYRDGHLYGFHGRQEYGPSLRCVELETGAVKWSRERFGSGSLIGVGERILLLHEDGRLQLLAASPSSFELLATTQLLSSVVRAYAAFSDGVLYARNQRELVATRLR